MLNKKQTFQNKFKVSVIGCGNVGATAAYAMLLQGTPTEITLIDMDAKRAEGLALDFKHGLSLLPFTQIKAGTDPKLTANSDLIVVTAGARQKEGQTRLDLIESNKQIFKKIIPPLAKHSPRAIMLIVSNPVDILTHLALKYSKFPANRVFGTGTMLDTIRLQSHISEKIKVNPRDIQAYILGEHGDTSFPVWSDANVGGKSIFDFPKFTRSTAEECYLDTRNAAYRIIHDIGFTCYSIAIVIREIMTAIYQNSRNVFPVSVELKGEYGLKNVALSVPCVIGENGIETKLEIPLSSQEKKQLYHSAETLSKFY